MPASRIPQPPSPRFGLIVIGETRRVALPLKGVDCEFSVKGGLLEVRMTQIFRQENARPLDCEYLFPLPADASVYDCTADINGRIIRARVREREAAVKLAQEKKSQGHRVALVEAERENLFTLTLSNLQPDDLVEVTLRYIQPVRMLADRPSVEIPFCPGVRYIPGRPLLRSNLGRGTVDDTDKVPDASRISPHRIDEDHPDAAFADVRGTIDSEFIDPSSIVSPSHSVVSRVEGTTVRIELARKGDVPDRDFVLRWEERLPEALAPRAWLCRHGEHRYGLVEVRAPRASGPAVPMDFYFLVDRSGSMDGAKWTKAVEAVQSAVRTLREADRAMVTLFSTDHRDFAEKPLPPGQLLEDRNFQNLARIGSDGGTNLGPALRHVVDLARRHSNGRCQSIVLITDAEVGNEEEILSIVAPAPELSLHCFGIDTALNDALLQSLARQQRGTFHSLNPNDDVAKAVTDLAQTIRHPVLPKVELGAGWETAEASLPPLYAGQVYRFAVRSASDQEITIRTGNGKEPAAFVPVAGPGVAGETPYLLWCKNRIQRYIAEKKPREAIALSEESNLICPLTAFIAWDEAEKVAVASHMLSQPALEPGLSLGASRLFRARSAGGEACLYASAPPPTVYDRRAAAQFRTLYETPLDPPEEMVEGIARRLRPRPRPARPDPYTLDQKRDAFAKVLQKVRDGIGRPDLQPLCDEVLSRVFDDPAEALERSNKLAPVLYLIIVQFRTALAAGFQSNRFPKDLGRMVESALTDFLKSLARPQAT